MGKFLTSHSRIEQLDIPEMWKLIDNQLYKDDDGTIYLCPRNYLTDGFSIPAALTLIAGSKMKWDTRCSSEHDFECSYHKVIVVNLVETQLRQKRLLRMHNNIEICENIPLEFLEIRDTTFFETNARFMRMLQSVQSIPGWRAKMMGYAVNLNFNWINYHIFDKDYIYEVDYGLLK